MSVPAGDFTSEGGTRNDSHHHTATRRMMCTPKMEVQELAQVVPYLLPSFWSRSSKLNARVFCLISSKHLRRAMLSMNFQSDEVKSIF